MIRRILFNLCGVFLLLLSIATAAGWVRSEFFEDVFNRDTVLEDSSLSSLTFVSSDGRFAVIDRTTGELGLDASTPWTHERRVGYVSYQDVRVASLTEDFWDVSNYRYVFVIRYWLLLSILLLALGSLLIARRYRPVRREGACTACGYNLTGNASGVCPECGSDVGEVAKG